jgi:hypothetical protein
VEGDVPPPTFVDPTFPPRLEAILMKALEVDPVQRYQNCDHLFRDLEAFLQEAELSWTTRKISGFMDELFGRGVPAEVHYQDHYDDLKDDALDFDSYDTFAPEAADEAPPDWARQLEAGREHEERTRKPVMTIGNLEALVAEEPRPSLEPDRSQDLVRSPQREGRGGRRRRAVRGTGPGSAAGARGSLGAGTAPGDVRQHSPSGAAGLRGSVGGSRAGPLAPGTGDSQPEGFGARVVSAQTRTSGARLAWLLAVLFGGTAVLYAAYSLFTVR